MSRKDMPWCARIVDALREVFGVEEINGVIKRGLRPECEAPHRVRFSEGGHVLGLAAPDVGGVTAAEMVIGPQLAAKKRGGV